MSVKVVLLSLLLSGLSDKALADERWFVDGLDVILSDRSPDSALVVARVEQIESDADSMTVKFVEFLRGNRKVTLGTTMRIAIARPPACVAKAACPPGSEGLRKPVGVARGDQLVLQVAGDEVAVQSPLVPLSSRAFRKVLAIEALPSDSPAKIDALRQAISQGSEDEKELALEVLVRGGVMGVGAANLLCSVADSSPKLTAANSAFVTSLETLARLDKPGGEATIAVVSCLLGRLLVLKGGSLEGVVMLYLSNILSFMPDDARRKTIRALPKDLSERASKRFVKLRKRPASSEYAGRCLEAWADALGKK